MTTTPENDKLTLTAPQEEAGARLDKWLADNLADFTRTRIKALIEAGHLTRDGETFTDPKWKIREGETFTLNPPPPVDATPKPENIPLTILHEDDDLIVIVKPAGLVVHPGAGNWHGTLVNALLYHCADTLSGIGGVARPGIVHRLDKDTSGVMVVAKNDIAHQGLAKQFSDHSITRIYQALVVGSPRPGMGKVDAPLKRKTDDRRKVGVVRDHHDETARHAVTHYKVTEQIGADRGKLPGEALAAHVDCTLETGRTHQIRVHMAHIGHPLIGDQTYGRGPGLAGLKPGDEAGDAAIKAIRAFKRQALHARHLGFTHPISGEKLAFDAPPPADFQALLEALRCL